MRYSKVSKANKEAIKHEAIDALILVGYAVTLIALVRVAPAWLAILGIANVTVLILAALKYRNNPEKD